MWNRHRRMPCSLVPVALRAKRPPWLSIRYTAKIIEPGMPSLTVFYVAPPAHRVGIVPACNSTSIREKPSAASAHARLTGRGYGMCKHMIALAFIFCDDPQRFEGYRAGAARPSRTLIDYMEHADRQDAQAKIRRRNAVMRRFDATQGKNGANARRTKSGYGSRAGTRGGGYQGDSETVGLGQVQLVPDIEFHRRRVERGVQDRLGFQWVALMR